MDIARLIVSANDFEALKNMVNAELAKEAIVEEVIKPIVKEVRKK